MSKVKITETRKTVKTYTKWVPEGFPANLMRARMAIGLSPSEMAQAIGIGPTYYYALETGRAEAGTRSLRRLNIALSRYGYEAVRETRIQKKGGK